MEGVERAGLGGRARVAGAICTGMAPDSGWIDPGLREDRYAGTLFSMLALAPPAHSSCTTPAQVDYPLEAVAHEDQGIDLLLSSVCVDRLWRRMAADLGLPAEAADRRHLAQQRPAVRHPGTGLAFPKAAAPWSSTTSWSSGRPGSGAVSPRTFRPANWQARWSQVSGSRLVRRASIAKTAAAAGPRFGRVGRGLGTQLFHERSIDGPPRLRARSGKCLLHRAFLRRNRSYRADICSAG